MNLSKLVRLPLWGVFVLFFLPLWAVEEKLTLKEVPRIMQEFFDFHVEHREMTPLMMKRALKVYCEQFDIQKLHLLQSEALAFHQISDELVKKALQDYQRGDFSEFVRFNQVIERAIMRARKVRAEIKKELASSGLEKSLHPIFYSTYAADAVEHKERIKQQLLRLIAEELELNQHQPFNVAELEKVVAFLETRFLRKEKNYLLFDEQGFLLTPKSEHLFAVNLLKTFAKSLDAHSAFFSPQEAEEMRSALEKQFEGVGVVLRESVNGVSIIELIKGGPAHESGKLAVGDRLVEVDGKLVASMGFEEVLKSMKGELGSELHLGIEHKNPAGELQRFQVALKRQKIALGEERLKITTFPWGNGQVGVLQLSSFYESQSLSSAERDMREALKKAQTTGPLKGLILDMRHNAGGFLNQAVKVAGLFIAQGVIVISKYAKDEVRYLREISGHCHYEGPLVVLTSKGSASAAEIVAGALQDYGIAIVVGDERTYGKGTIQYQTVTDQAAKLFFKVTVGRYYTVSGKSAQLDGIEADIRVPTELAFYNIGEKYLEYPLPNDRMPSAFVDPLTDVDQKNRFWFQEYYLPNIRPRETAWTKMVPTLAENSRERLKQDKNFSAFLRTYQGAAKKGLRVKPEDRTWGNEDLQLKEALHILSDMQILRALSPALLPRK